MRTIITISLVSIIAIFILIVTPEKENGFLVEEKLAQGGKVLGATENILDGSYKQYKFEDLGFPGPIEQEKESDVRPSKKSDAEEIGNFGCPAMVIDKKTDEVLYAEEADRKVPIASLTKLMTALVAVDLAEDQNNFYQITGRDMVGGGKFFLKPGDKVKISDLLNLSLVASDNSSTKALVNSTGLEEKLFVEKMNERARSLGMANTNFLDPIGLSWQNQSTAEEIVLLMKEITKNDDLKTIIGKSEYEFATMDGRFVKATTTNNLLKKYPKEKIDLEGGKTGHTEAAGYCLASAFSADDKDIISVVLGAKENYQRFSFTDRLVKWVYDNYMWEKK